MPECGAAGYVLAATKAIAPTGRHNPAERRANYHAASTEVISSVVEHFEG